LKRPKNKTTFPRSNRSSMAVYNPKAKAMHALKSKSPNTNVWTGRMPTVNDEGKPDGGEDVVLMLANIRPEPFPMKVGDRLARLSREEAIRVAKNLLDQVVALQAVDQAKAAGAHVS